MENHGRKMSAVNLKLRPGARRTGVIRLRVNNGLNACQERGAVGSDRPLRHDRASNKSSGPHKQDDPTG